MQYGVLIYTDDTNPPTWLLDKQTNQPVLFDRFLDAEALAAQQRQNQGAFHCLAFAYVEG